MEADPITSNAVDALFNEDYDSDDPFGDRTTNKTSRDDKPTLSPRKRKAEEVFGVDEEVKIAKQRKKIPKLDAERLLSEPGVPKLRSLIRSGQLKKKLRLKGKGHEFSDAAKLLNYYQLWLDQLYPRAKFGDALQMVEKAGHTKKMAMYRKSWIDESKPGFIRREDIEVAVEQSDQVEHLQEPAEAEKDEDPASLFFNGGAEEDAQNLDPDDDELDALMAQETRPSAAFSAGVTARGHSEGEDDLDALLAEQDAVRYATNTSHVRSNTTNVPGERQVTITSAQDDEQDDLDALFESEQATAPQQISSSRGHIHNDDELNALLNEEPIPNDPPAHKESQPSEEVQEEQDDLEALLANPVSDSDSDDLNILPPNTSQPKLPPVLNTAQVPGSEEVPELDEFASSSPIPNVQTDELDELMDEHEEALKAKEAGSDSAILEAMFSSSPIPNRESQ